MGMMKRIEAHWGDWVINYRWLIIAVIILAVLGAAYGLRFLTFNKDTRVFFSEDNPQLQALEALENIYIKVDTVFFALVPQDGNVFTRKTLTAVEELTEAAWQTPYSNRVSSITNFQHTRAREDELIVEDLVRNAGSLSEKKLNRIKQVALAEPLLMNYLISPSGHMTGIAVEVCLPGESNEEVTEVADFARDLAENIHKKYPDIEIYLTGGIMIDQGFGQASQDDLTTLIPMMFAALIILVGIFLRSISGTIATLVIILISMITAMGGAGWMGISLNTASVNAPLIILTLAVADSIHILVAVFRHMRQGKSKHEAITESMRINLQPVFLTSATTSVGFLSMNFSDAPPFRDLGNIVAVGVAVAFIYSVLFLPALMAVLPLRVKPGTDSSDRPHCARLANFVIGRRRVIFWGVLLIIIVMTIGITRIELNDNFVEYFDHRYDFRRATDFVQEQLTGWDIIEYSLEAGGPGGIHDPNYLKTVDDFAKWYRGQPKVVHVNTITDTIKRLNQNMHGDDESWYRIPEQRELAAQYLLLYEMSLPFGLDLNNQINVGKSATRMIVTLRYTTTRELRKMDEKARQWLKANAPVSMLTYGSGLSIIWAHISQRNIHSMLGASVGALLLISGILVLALRSLKLGLLSLIPNLAPAFMAFGIWGILVGRVGLALSVLVALTLGIVVDDTVHFLNKYLRARRENHLNATEAVRYAFNTVGTAMWITTAVLVVGFFILSFSGFKMNSDLGLMTAITIMLALVLDFFFLPVLLMKTDK